MTKRVVIRGGAGQVAYHLLFLLGAGGLLGHKEPLILQILETPEMMPALQGVKMELEDCAFPCVEEICIGSDPHLVFEGADYVFLRRLIN